MRSIAQPASIEPLLRALPRACIRRPRLAILLMLGLTFAAAPGLSQLRLRTDGHALVPHDDPAVRVDAAIRRHFDLRDPIVILIDTDHADGIYNSETLRTVANLSDAVSSLAGVEPDQVVSLATERRDRVYPGTLKFRPFLDPFPDSPQSIRQLRSDVEATELLTGTLVAADGAATTILVGVPETLPSGDRAGLYRSILDAVDALGTVQDRIVVVGAPVAEALLGTHLLEDLSLLLPLSISLIALVVWLGCRRLWGVALALTEVGACLLWTFGVMGWVGVPVYLTIAVLPVILTTIGLVDEIHLFWHYQRRLAAVPDGPHPAAVVETMDRMGRPVVLTSLTTSIGFLSFLASPIAPVRAFGLFAALGIVFCMLWSLTVIPALLTLIAPERLRRPSAGPGSRWIVSVAGALIERRRLTLAVVLLVSLAAISGLFRLQVQDSWIGGFARGSPFRLATERANEELLGTHLLLAHLEFDTAGPKPLLDPELIGAIGRFETFARERPEVGGVLGTFSHVSTVRFLLSARRVVPNTLPASRSEMEDLMVYFDKVRGAQRRRQLIDDELRRTVVTIFLKDANYRDTARLMAALQEYAGRELGPLGARLDFAGDVAVSQAMIPAIVRTQITSLSLALGIALVAVSLMLGSMRTGLYATLPASIAALWVLGAMGWLGIPLGVATSMFCAITLGIGIDYGIHLLEGIRRAREAGLDPVPTALAEVGPAITADTAAIALGFGLLAFSRVPANSHLGVLVALALVAGCVLTLGGLGALLGVRPRPGRRSPAEAPGSGSS